MRWTSKMSKMSKVFPRLTRDTHPALQDAEVRQGAIAVARLDKALLLASHLYATHTSTTTPLPSDDTAWEALSASVSIPVPSYTVRYLVPHLLAFAEVIDASWQQGKAVEWVEANCTPGWDVFRQGR